MSEHDAVRAKDARRGRRWIGIVVALLVGHVIAVIVLIVSATGDPSHQVIPDYYRKAMRWDQHMAQQRTNAELGWRLELTMRRLRPTAVRRVGLVEVGVALDDRLGRPLRGATVELATFHKARAGNVVRALLAEQAPGHYSASLPMMRLGLWQLDFVVTHGKVRFTRRVDRELVAGVGKLAVAPAARGRAR